GVLPGQHARAGRTADGVLAVGPFVPHPLLGEPVGDGRTGDLATVAPVGVVALLVRGDEEDLAAHGVSFVLGGAGCGSVCGRGSVAPYGKVRGAAKSHVSGCAVRGVRRPCRDPVAGAVGPVAQVGASSDHPCRAGGWADRVHPGGGTLLAVPIGAPPLRAPFPHVARAAVQAVTARRGGVGGGRPQVTVGAQVVGGKIALPDVAA